MRLGTLRAAAVAAAVLAAAVLVLGFHRAARVGLGQKPSEQAEVPAAGRPRTQSGVAKTAEHDVDTIGRDALKMWGEWDGLSPVMTQMMSQTHPAAAPPSATAARSREQGMRGRVRERTVRPKASDKHTPAQSLHRDGDIHADGTLEHDERAVAPFPYVTAVISLHGVQHELHAEERLDLKQSIAEAVGLDNYGSGGMRAVLGQEAYQWITFDGGGAVNCSEVPHICDDKGRRCVSISVPVFVAVSVPVSVSVSVIVSCSIFVPVSCYRL